MGPSRCAKKEVFHSKDPKKVSYAKKVKPKPKFLKKILVWQAIDEDGNISDPFVSEGTITGDVYLTECIQGKLLPVIDKLHRREDVFFWPDMATSHYTTKVTTFLKEQNVEFMAKTKTALNVPQARGIERFWAPKTLRGFEMVWRNISRKVAQKTGKAIMDSTFRTIRNIGY